MPPNYTDDEKAAIRELADGGASWEEIGQVLGRSATAVEFEGRRMRRRGEWPENPDSVRERPDGPGRPRNRRRTTAVSVRFAPDVEAAVRSVARDAGCERRPGTVLTEAIRRAVARAEGRRLKGSPLGLHGGESFQLTDADKTATLSVSVDAEALERLVALRPDVPPTVAVHDATVQLLCDLNFTIG